MSLDVIGFIDDTFESNIGTRTSYSNGAYVEGKWVQNTPNAPTTHRVNLQPVTDGKEIAFLELGGERISDARVVYVNDGLVGSISQSDTWEFSDIDGVFKTVKVDNRPSRNYARLVVVREDP